MNEMLIPVHIMVYMYKYIGSIQKHEIVTIINKTCFSLRVSDYCLTPNEQFFSYIMASTIYIR